MLLLLRKAFQLPFELISVSGTLVHADYPKHWLKLALFSLLLSGLFSLVIVVARTPGIAELIGDPLFARKSLVLHVDFALVVWFYAFLAALYLSLTRRAGGIMYSLGLKLGLAGTVMMIIPVFLKGVEPVLANYIPVLDHPIFLAGLLLIAAGLTVTFWPARPANDQGISSRKTSFYTENAEQAIQYAGVLVVVAILTIITSYIITPEMSTRTLYYELVMWGGGHILQFANVIGMLTVWMILIHKLTGREMFSKTANRWLVTILAVPAILSPILLAQGTATQLYYSGYTQLMRWFIFPVVMIYMFAGIKTIYVWKKTEDQGKSLFSSLCFNAVMVSMLLTLIGFIIGAMIRGSSTLIPAHYHASLGGVTVAYMAMVFILMKEYGYSLKTARGRKLTRIQPLLFGVGQSVFVIGFAMAGIMGMGRKLFGQDQNIYSVEALAGLGLMSIGGLTAMAGGILFIYILIKSYKEGHYGRSNQ
jgi:cytochrome c oxidase subunit I